MTDLHAAVPACVCAFSLAAALLIPAAPVAGQPVAAVFPPWWSSARAAAEAARSGLLVRFGTLPFIVVIAPPAPGRSPGVPHGAWLLLDPVMLGGCSAAKPETTNE